MRRPLYIARRDGTAPALSKESLRELEGRAYRGGRGGRGKGGGPPATVGRGQCRSAVSGTSRAVSVYCEMSL